MKPTRKSYLIRPGLFEDWTTAILLCTVLLAVQAVIIIVLVGIITIFER